MKQKVKFQTQILMFLAVLSTANLLLLWRGLSYRLYFSASIPYYAGLLARSLLPEWGFLSTVGVFSLLCCACYGACAVSTKPAEFGLCFYALDTVFLLLAALFLVKNPLCCLPELLAHGVILLLLCPSFSAWMVYKR